MLTSGHEDSVSLKYPEIFIFFLSLIPSSSLQGLESNWEDETPEIELGWQDRGIVSFGLKTVFHVFKFCLLECLWSEL